MTVCKVIICARRRSLMSCFSRLFPYFPLFNNIVTHLLISSILLLIPPAAFVVSLKYLAIVINLPSMGTWASMTLFFDFMRLREAALLFMPRGAMILFSIKSSQLIPEALFNTSPATIYNRLSYSNFVLKLESGFKYLRLWITSSVLKFAESGQNIKSPAPKPKPERWVNQSLTVNSELTKGSCILNSGIKSVTLLSQVNLPPSINMPRANAVKALLFDAMAKAV